jgi:hypothetical protein
VTLPGPPRDWRDLVAFPSLVLRAHQPLSRVHRQELGTLYFATHQDGRWNPPQPNASWGTCYLSTHPLGALVEVLGRLLVIPQREIDRRVLASVFLGSDLRLADMTHPSILGAHGLTAEVSAGDPVSTYPLTQRWAERLQQAGFSGIHYAARHDPRLGSRSVAVFGKHVGTGHDISTTEEWDTDSLITTEPISTDLIDQLVDEYGVRVVGGGTAL